MNRIETKIIMTVTNRLAAAKDTDTKTELIEELSENLYQRYEELAGSGMPEEEALTQAMDSLGDVDELLAYLRDVDEQEADASQDAADADGTGNDAGQNGESTDGNAGRSWGFSFNTADLESSIEDVVSAAISTARDAMDCAKDVARDVSEQLKEKYPDGFFTFTVGGQSETVNCTSIASEGIHSLDVRLTNGDVELCFAEDMYAPIEITGDTEEIQTVVRDGGILSVKQGNTASSSFLFTRGVRTSDIMIRLPKRFWTNLNITTSNGDVSIAEGLACRGLAVQTLSGDVSIEQGHAERMAFKMTSGDIHAEDVSGDLFAETKSGDIEVCGELGRLGLSSVSGDIRFEGTGTELRFSTISGDQQLRMTTLPEKLKIASKSGDSILYLPDDQGFTLTCQTVSGELRSQLPLTGTTNNIKNGRSMYLDGGSSEIQISSVSGDTELQRL